MSTVSVVITTTAQVLPTGVTFGTYQYEILDSDGVTVVQTMNSTALSVTFPNPVPAGTYIASAQALDSTNAKLGTAATATFTVAAAATFEQPATVTVTQAS